MDNDELRGLLADLAKDNPRPRLAGVLEIRAANYLREHGARLLADSEAYAKLRAEIAGAVQSVRDAELFEDGIEADAHGLGIHTIADAYMAGRQHALDELVALLRLPVGEVEG